VSERLTSFISESKERVNRASFKCSLWVGKHSVNLFSEYDHFIPFFRGKGVEYVSSIPGWGIDENPSETEYSIIYLPDEESELIFDYENKTLYALGKLEDYKDGQALAYLSFWLTEAQRQAESIYTLHSSALTVKEKGVLMIGHSGAGKTSIMLDLCQKYDCEVISNDLTFVKHNPVSRDLYLIEGTKEIRLRLASIEANFPQLKYLFSGQPRSSWETKTIVMPNDIGLKTADSPRKLDSIFEIHLDNKGKDDLVVRREDGIVVRFRLYEDMSRIVRGSAISVFGENNQILGYIPSLDSYELHRKRVDSIEAMMSETGIISVSGGNLSQITEAIYRISHQA